MTRRFYAAAVVALFSVPSAAQAAFSYGTITYTDVADTFVGSSYKQTISYPAINNSGQVAFSVLSTANAQFVYTTRTSPAGFNDIADTSHGFGGMSTFTLNNAGVAVFSGSSSTGPNAGNYGIFSGNGGVLTTVADSHTSVTPFASGLTPRIADNGAAVFLGTVGGNESITIGQGGSFTNVVVNDHSTFENFTDYAINNSTQVALNTDDYSTGSNNGAFVYRYTAGPGLVKISRATTNTSVGINDSGVIAFQASTSTGNGFPTTGIFTSDGATTTAISRYGLALPGTATIIDSYAAASEGTPINNLGLVAIHAGNSTLATTNGIYIGDGTNTTNIIHLGQTLFGKTVSSVGLGRDAINDIGQVTFNVNFTDGTTAVVVTSGAPEPACLSLMIGGLGMLALRRRRAV